MNSSRPFQLKLVDIRPTQLYINAAKIANIRKIYNPISLEVIPPVPVTKLKNGTVFFVDGHTRAFVAWKHGGLNEINVVWESGEFDLEAYEICRTRSTNIFGWIVVRRCNVNWKRRERSYTPEVLKKK